MRCPLDVSAIELCERRRVAIAVGSERRPHARARASAHVGAVASAQRQTHDRDSGWRAQPPRPALRSITYLRTTRRVSMRGLLIGLTIQNTCSNHRHIVSKAEQ